jgi:hypothetical protein
MNAVRSRCSRYICFDCYFWKERISYVVLITLYRTRKRKKKHRHFDNQYIMMVEYLLSQIFNFSLKYSHIEYEAENRAQEHWFYDYFFTEKAEVSFLTIWRTQRLCLFCRRKQWTGRNKKDLYQTERMTTLKYKFRNNSVIHCKKAKNKYEIVGKWDIARTLWILPYSGSSSRHSWSQFDTLLFVHFHLDLRSVSKNDFDLVCRQHPPSMIGR